MAPRYVETPSNGEINRAGDLLAAYDPTALVTTADIEALSAAFDTVDQFRRAHAAPMNSIAMGLRSMVRTATGEPHPLVSQRLKRIPRIIRKVRRMEGQPGGPTRLARLEDIGGVRAVVFGIRDLHHVLARIERNWGAQITRRRDLIASPRAIGYRAHHVVVERRGRRIEVQLRTYRQQRWADAIEAMDSRHNLNLKDGTGPESLVEYFQAASDYLYHEDHDLEIPTELQQRVDNATNAVVEAGYYSRRRSS